MTRNVVTQLFIFFILAFAVTFAINHLPKINIGKVDITGILCGFGPLLSALCCYKFFKTPNKYEISFLGVKHKITYFVLGLAILLPILLITKVPKATIVISILTQFIYSFGEEFGWRHYLLNATASLNKWIRPFIMGTIWFVWHYSFIDNPILVITGQNMPIFTGALFCILILSILTFLWSDVTIKTKSIVMPTIAHSITKFGDPISIGVVITVLLLLQIFWKKIKV